MPEPRKTYRIDIGQLARFRDMEPVHRQGHSKKGTFNSFLFGQLGREEAPGYIAGLKNELGEPRFDTLIESLVTEVPIEAPPEPEVASEQLELPRTRKPRFEKHLEALGFIKDMDKNHPAVAVANAWKATHRMSFITFDKLKDRLGPDPVVWSAKMDGELVCVWFADGNTSVVTTKGTVRTDIPATNEATEALSKRFKNASFMGELYAVDENGKPQSYMRSASILKDPKSDKDDQIRLAIFDVVEVDGKSYEDHPTMEKMRFIQEVFANTEYVHPAYTEKSTIEKIEEVWNELDKKGFEGVVVHMPDGTILKSKPILSFDMMIVAVTKGVATPGRVGAILASFIDKEGRYRLNGHIGTGLTDEQRLELMKWAQDNMVREDDEYIWVDPSKSPVIEVEAVEINPKMQPALEYRDGKYVEIEKMMSGTMRFPVLKHTRPDKDPSYPDVRVEQLPFETSIHLQPGMKIRTITGQKGVIQQLVPRSGDSGQDYDLIIKWDEPVWGIEISEVHPTEITGLVVPPEKHDEVPSLLSS